MLYEFHLHHAYDKIIQLPERRKRCQGVDVGVVQTSKLNCNPIIMIKPLRPSRIYRKAQNKAIREVNKKCSLNCSLVKNT